MTQTEFNSINWHRGNEVRLTNGKEYLVKGIKGHGRYLLLYSAEYDSSFVADHVLVDCRTSDYEEPVEVYLEMKRQRQEAALAKREAERQEALRIKEERRRLHLEQQERAHQEAVARKAAAKLLKQQEQQQKQEEQKQKAKESVKPVAKESVKPVAKESVKPVVKQKPEEVKAAEPVAEAPKKRVRQRIRISASPVREKVEIVRKK